MKNQIQYSKPQKWYHNKTTIVLLLIFLYPIGFMGLLLRSETKIWKKIVASIPGFFLFILILLAILLPPINYYELAANEIKSENYLSAYNYLSQVEKSDENYKNSQKKLKEIENLAQKKADSVLTIITENYNQINQMIETKEFNGAKKITKKTLKLFDNIELIYPEIKQKIIYNNLIKIKKFKKKEIENTVDSLNSITFISKTLGNLSNEQFEALKNDSFDFVIFDNSALNYILLLKLKENNELRAKYLEEQLNEIANNNLEEYVKQQVGRLSDKQFRELQNGTLDTLIIEDTVLNSLLLSKMTNNTDLRKKYLQEEVLRKEQTQRIARKNKIASQFSSWDGSHSLLKKYIKENMNDPRSFKHVRTTYSDHSNYLLVKMTFRGKNAFGATVINVAESKATIDGDRIYDIRIY